MIEGDRIVHVDDPTEVFVVVRLEGSGDRAIIRSTRTGASFRSHLDEMRLAPERKETSWSG